jgi:hypothetical protein
VPLHFTGQLSPHRIFGAGAAAGAAYLLVPGHGVTNERLMAKAQGALERLVLTEALLIAPAYVQGKKGGLGKFRSEHPGDSTCSEY